MTVIPFKKPAKKGYKDAIESQRGKVPESVPAYPDKIRNALAKYGHESGTESLKRNREGPKKVTIDDQFSPTTDQPDLSPQLLCGADHNVLADNGRGDDDAGGPTPAD